MSEEIISSFKKVLELAEIAIIGNSVKGSLTYLPYGFSIRQRLYDLGTNLLIDEGFQQILLTDLVNKQSLKEIDKISPISQNYFSSNTETFSMAAGHEIPFYLLLKHILRNHSQKRSFPLNYFHLGAVYRYPKNSKFPFNIGERKTFLECYSIHKTSEQAYNALEVGTKWNRTFIKQILKLPSIEVNRPIITNKKFSDKTVCIDSLTPIGLTAITGMTYFHNDIFTKALNVKFKDTTTGKNSLVYSTHFGVSENIFFSYLLNSFEPTGLRLLSILAPIQISILDSSLSFVNSILMKEMKIFFLKQNNRFEVTKISSRDIKYSLNQNTLKGIPLTILVKELANGIFEFSLICNGKTELVSLDSLFQSINYSLVTNDEYIFRKFRNMEVEGIINCDQIEAVRLAISSGKVSKVYCEKTDEKTRELESKLDSGEILGFQQVAAPGIDIIDGTKTTSTALISRRS